MKEKNPYQVVKHQRVTEKAIVLENLKNATSNVSLARCKSPKYVFVVEKTANKKEIAEAIEQIYSSKNVKVVAVNTINVKAKSRRVRGRLGMTASFKKAIVTLQEGDSLESV
ncbi:50S ribosomal protein L23 [Chlamydiales bacterium STE3]|nr:50S ribosomal protein L23 [Chlamydiales bacterium STE3]